MKRLFALVALLGMSVMAAEKTIYDFTMNSIDGQPTPLSTFKGKVVLLVNVASTCSVWKMSGSSSNPAVLSCAVKNMDREVAPLV